VIGEAKPPPEAPRHGDYQRKGEREMKNSQPIYGGVRDDFGFREGEDARGFTEEESALWYKSDAHEHHLNVMQQRDERRLREHQEAERRAWPATRAGQLLKKLGECFAEYKECLEHDPRLMEKALAFDEMNQKIFKQDADHDGTSAPGTEMPAPQSGRRDVLRAASAREEILPHARDAGSGASGED
jgi:hypothetical protein